jgi:hypothetical protein
MNNGLMPLMGFPQANSSNQALAPQFIDVQAGDSISAGNLVTMRADGRVYPAPTSGIPASWFNNTSQKTITALSQSAAFDSAFDNGNFWWVDPANGIGACSVAGTELTCVLWTGDGSSSPYAGIRLRTLNRNNQIATTQVTTASNQIYPQIHDLRNGSVLVLHWNGGSPGRWVYTIYNASTLAIVSGPTTLPIDSSNNSSAVAAAVLSNGNVVLAVRDFNSSILWRVISNTGTVVVSDQTFTGGNNSGLSVAAGGGFFAIAHQQSSELRIRRYTNAGALVGSEIATGESVNAGFSGFNVGRRIFIRSDGSLLYFRTPASNASVRVYDTSNNIVANQVLQSNSNGQLYTGLVNDVLQVIYNFDSTARSICRFGADNQVKINQRLWTFGVEVVLSPPGTPNAINRDVYDVGSDGSIYGVAMCSDTPANSRQTFYFNFDQNASFVSSVAVSGISSPREPAFVKITRDTVMAAMGNSGSFSDLGSMRAGYYFPVIQSVFGVAASGASAGQNCRVQVAGSAAVTPSVAGGAAFDQRTATVPGNRGVFGGSGAILYGL